MSRLERLFDAVSNNDAAAAERLLARGGLDLEAVVGDYGATCLMQAAARGHVAMVRLLLLSVSLNTYSRSSLSRPFTGVQWVWPRNTGSGFQIQDRRVGEKFHVRPGCNSNNIIQAHYHICNDDRINSVF